MKKTVFADEVEVARQESLNEDLLTPKHLAKPEEKSLQPASQPADAGLDLIFSIAKWVLLYLPGIFSLQMATMGIALMLFYRQFEPLGAIGLLVLGTFLIMLSFGKLLDLKYLKTVLTIIGFAALLAIFYDLLAVFIKGDFLKLYVSLTYPILVVIGFLAKRALDAEDKQT